MFNESTLPLGDIIADLYSDLESHFGDEQLTSVAVATLVNELLANQAADEF